MKTLLSLIEFRVDRFDGAHGQGDVDVEHPPPSGDVNPGGGFGACYDPLRGGPRII